LNLSVGSFIRVALRKNAIRVFPAGKWWFSYLLTLEWHISNFLLLPYPHLVIVRLGDCVTIVAW